MELLKLEVGKTYMCTMGHPVNIDGFEDGYYISDDDIPYNEDGTVFISGRTMTDHKLCLVSCLTSDALPYGIMTHFMIDLETMGLDNNALITTISIVAFDLGTGDIGSTFEIALDWNEQIDNGAILNADTVQWWLKQEPDAIKNMMRLPQGPIEVALDNLNSYFIATGLDLTKIKLWGNGKEFDNVLIRNLYKRHNRKFPVPYWCDNDVRTLVSLADINTKNFKFEGIKHRGIDDCKHQINYCSHAYRVLKGN